MHSVAVTADSRFEAATAAVSAFRQEGWATDALTCRRWSESSRAAASITFAGAADLIVAAQAAAHHTRRSATRGRSLVERPDSRAAGPHGQTTGDGNRAPAEVFGATLADGIRFSVAPNIVRGPLRGHMGGPHPLAVLSGSSRHRGRRGIALDDYAHVHERTARAVLIAGQRKCREAWREDDKRTRRSR